MNNFILVIYSSANYTNHQQYYIIPENIVTKEVEDLFSFADEAITSENIKFVDPDHAFTCSELKDRQRKQHAESLAWYQPIKDTDYEKLAKSSAEAIANWDKFEKASHVLIDKFKIYRRRKHEVGQVFITRMYVWSLH
jgi:hypothetical protein